jgi:hypothetical protein
MSCSGEYNFCFRKSFVKDLSYRDALGVPIAVGAWTGKLTIRYRDSSISRFVAEFSTANGKLVLANTLPNIVVTATVFDLADMPSGLEHDYALELYPSSGQVETVVSGTVIKEYSPV